MPIAISDLGVYTTSMTNLNSWFLVNEQNPNVIELAKIFRNMDFINDADAAKFVNNFTVGLSDNGLTVPSNVINAVKFFIGFFVSKDFEFMKTAMIYAFNNLKQVHKNNAEVKIFLIYLNTTYNLGFGIDYE